MTSKLTREERVQSLYGLKIGQVLNPSDIESIKMLARMALAAMDGEPVAYTDEAELCFVNDMACMWTKGMGINEVPLYRHAQQPVAVTDDELNAALQLHRLKVDGHSQLSDSFRAGFRYARRTTPQPAPVAPAVSDDIGEIRVGRLPTMNQDDYPGLGDWWVQLRIGEDSDEVLARVYGATPQEANNRAEALACRAAMLQASPVCTCPSGDGSLRWPCPVHPGNSPVVPDDVLGALQKVARIRLDMNDFDGDRRGIADCLGDAEEALIEVVNRRAAMLAAAPQPQNAPQNIPEIIPNELIAAVNRLLDSNGSRGCYSAIQCGDAHDEIERLLAASPQEVKGE